MNKDFDTMLAFHKYLLRDAKWVSVFHAWDKGADDNGAGFRKIKNLVNNKKRRKRKK